MSHVLSAVLTRATGKSTCAYAHEKLLGPLGIGAEHWGRDPNGVFSGGYNLYMTPRELARFGLLFLRDGEWEGTKLVPPSWVEESIQPQLPAEGGYDYGYYWWLRGGSPHDVAIAWGFGGQFVPALDLMVVMTADTANDHDELDGQTFPVRPPAPGGAVAALDPTSDGASARVGDDRVVEGIPAACSRDERRVIWSTAP